MDFWRPKASSSANQCAPKSTTLHSKTAKVNIMSAGRHCYEHGHHSALQSCHHDKVMMRPSAGRCCMREQPARVAREQLTAGQRPLLHMHGRVRGEQDVVWAKRGLRDGGEVAHVGLVRANEAKLVLDLASGTRLSAAWCLRRMQGTDNTSGQGGSGHASPSSCCNPC